MENFNEKKKPNLITIKSNEKTKNAFNEIT